MYRLNLKSIALPVPGIIGASQKISGRRGSGREWYRWKKINNKILYPNQECPNQSIMERLCTLNTTNYDNHAVV